MAQPFLLTEEGSRPRLSKGASGTSPPEHDNAVSDALLRCGRLIATPLDKRRVFSFFEVSPLGVVALRGGVWGTEEMGPNGFPPVVPR